MNFIVIFLLCRKMSLDLLNSFELFMYIQTNFSRLSCNDIFPDDSAHYWKKWLECDGNGLNFISRLDDMNKLRIFIWASKSMKV